MRNLWLKSLHRFLSWVGAGSSVAVSAATPAFAALPTADTGGLSAQAHDPQPLVFERPNYNDGQERFAGHSSHASHASHSSHYSSSGGGYSVPDDNSPPPPQPASPPTPPPATFHRVPAAVPSSTEKRIIVMRAQAKLHELGYFTGKIDGVFGQDTRDALGNYQIVQGIAVTGRLDDQTLAALGITY